MSEHTKTESLQGQSTKRADGRAISLEVGGELVLLSMVAGFFIYILVSAADWNFAAILTPAIAITIGTPFLIWRFIHVIRTGIWPRQADAPRKQIMDMGFRIGVDAAAERMRFVRILVAIGILYAGILVLGFHVTVPLWVFIYMYRYGKVRFLTAAFVALFFLGFMIGVYDLLAEAYWNKPLILQWFS